MVSSERPKPTGECWCGCGKVTVKMNSFFKPGHDRTAESAVISVVYGGIPEFLECLGFGPGGRNAKSEGEEWKAQKP